MTQSTDKSKNQPLPLPPIVPPTVRQSKTYIDSEEEDFGEETRVKMPNAMPPIGKNNPPQSPPTAPKQSNSNDFDDFDDFDDLEEDEELTTVTNPNLMGSSKAKSPPLSPPPKTPQSPPMRVPRSGVSFSSNEPTQIKSPPTMPVGANRGKAAGLVRPPGAPPIRRNYAPSPTTPAPVGRAPGQPSLEELVKLAYEKSYSDVHLGVGEVPRMRDRGDILTLDEYPEIDLNTFMSWLREILNEEEIQKFKKELEFDGATQYEFARVRINVFDTLRGPSLVLRLIPLKIFTMEQLRLPNVFRDVSDAHKGLVLITGPTGSGKSTTLAAMIDYINNEHPKNIITIEDPVEFVHKSRKSLIKQREVGQHTLLFDNALKASLREDPDIILVGEMRDKGTVNTALKAAQTGHLVMGTLHTNSAVKTLERILTLYTAEEQPALRAAIAESLVAIIAQGLCRTTDGKRAAYHDILINTETIKDYIKDGKYDEITALMRDGEFDGMVTMNQSLFNLYQEGRITEETALEHTPTRNEMAMMLRGKI